MSRAQAGDTQGVQGVNGEVHQGPGSEALDQQHVQDTEADRGQHGNAAVQTQRNAYNGEGHGFQVQDAGEGREHHQFQSPEQGRLHELADGHQLPLEKVKTKLSPSAMITSSAAGQYPSFWQTVLLSDS